jgi:hypothetical protein
MKARDSGMPDETCWQNFFDVDCIVAKRFIYTTWSLDEYPSTTRAMSFMGGIRWL